MDRASDFGSEGCGFKSCRGYQVTVQATAESVDWVTSALAAVGFDGPIDVVAGGGEWPLVVRAATDSVVLARGLERRLVEPLGPLQRIGLVGELGVGVAVGLATPLSVRVDDRMVVSFGDAAEHGGGDDLVLRVSPGLGFGSGLHPGTLVCLRLVGRYARAGTEALDLGCGSGIVSVALARLGACVVAVDNDPAAVAAAAETVRRNGVEAAVSVSRGSLGRGSALGHWLGWGDLEVAPPVETGEGFDLIAANILSSVHVGLAADYRAALRPGGVLVTAGFTVHQVQDTSDALVEAGLESIDLAQQGEFVALAHRRPS